LSVDLLVVQGRRRPREREARTQLAYGREDSREGAESGACDEQAGRLWEHGPPASESAQPPRRARSDPGDEEDDSRDQDRRPDPAVHAVELVEERFVSGDRDNPAER